METGTKLLLTILVPCHDEEANLMCLYKALDEFSHSSYAIENVKGESETMVNISDLDLEFLFVDDGSKDSTRSFLKACRKKIQESM